MSAASTSFSESDDFDHLPGFTSIFAIQYDARREDWGRVESVNRRDLFLARSPQIAIGPAGDAIAVWIQQENAGPT